LRTPDQGEGKTVSRIIASIEARMGATRLPGKVLSDIGGVPALTRVLRRLRRCRLIDDIILATTINQKDDVLAQWAESESVACFRGSESDVLSRVVGAQRKMDSDIVVEIWGDMPLLDPAVVDMGIKTFLGNDCDVVTTTYKPSYPQGIDAVVFNLKELEWVQENIAGAEIKEHVSLYFFKHPEKYRILNLFAPDKHEAPTYRFVLDYPEDLALIREIYKHLLPKHGDCFGLDEVMELVRENPELVQMNRRD
jgi:spore coat polysaccharide biosynthesis protein SpsF